MKKLFLGLFVFCTIASSGQTVKPIRKNLVSLQFGQNTPLLGLSFQREIFRNKKLSLETGLGVGLLPRFKGLLSLSDQVVKKQSNVSLGHGIWLFFGQKPVRFSLGYSGILAHKQYYAGNRGNYYPIVYTGLRFGKSESRVNMNIGINTHFYGEDEQILKGEDEIWISRKIKFATIPGISFGYRF